MKQIPKEILDELITRRYDIIGGIKGKIPKEGLKPFILLKDKKITKGGK